MIIYLVLPHFCHGPWPIERNTKLSLYIRYMGKVRFAAVARSPLIGSTASIELPFSHPLQRESSGCQSRAHQVHHHDQLHPDSQCRRGERHQFHRGNSTAPHSSRTQNLYWERNGKKLILRGPANWTGETESWLCEVGAAKDWGDPLWAESAWSCLGCGRAFPCLLLHGIALWIDISHANFLVSMQQTNLVGWPCAKY